MLWELLIIATLLGCLSTSVGFLGRSWWIFELASHFRIQYSAFLTLSSILLFLNGHFIGAAVATFFALVNLRLLLPFYVRLQSPLVVQNTYQVILANVLKQNISYNRLRKFIRTNRPDLIILIEVDQNWMRELDCLRTEFPHISSAPRKDDYGIAVFSRIPFSNVDITSFGDDDRPTIVAQFVLEDQPFTLIAPHPPPPRSKHEAELRNRQLSEIGRYLGEKNGPRILAGDLNVTPWSPYFKELTEKGSLHESRRGFGLQPSWPTTFPLLYIPIDHILVSSEIKVHQRRVGPRIGSDHLPVIVDFSIHIQS